jgi:hypothetical protein
LYTLKLAFTGVANQGKAGSFVYMNSLHRAGVDTNRAAIALVLIQLNPVFPGQGPVGAGRDTLMILAGQAYSDDRRFRPIRFNIDAGAFGGIFAKVGPRADCHADFTFSAKRAV